MAVSNDNKPWCSTKRQGFCCMCFGHLEWLIFTYFNGDCIKVKFRELHEMQSIIAQMQS